MKASAEDQKNRDLEGLPKLAVGHIIHYVAEMERSYSFYTTLGMRTVLKRPKMAILELRGGTHLLLFAKKSVKALTQVKFDLMVDDLEDYRKYLASNGIESSKPIFEKVSGHYATEIVDPDGAVVPVYSSHTDGRLV
ncbi:MAG: VOC family protein [Oligoflexales bacterium]